ncbi:hypothetical protein OHB12_04485 [Nocardia sp. NBC_01730]|uniref:DUF6603 domain-containing protein n=1 Tax=Nocardia sp. NBC_01730 TaxID=2975998 RepID=UPI002E157DB1|nr:hypothetical protein OHB12_04485 [Nocardia sp. NBC_01730]
MSQESVGLRMPAAGMSAGVSAMLGLEIAGTPQPLLVLELSRGSGAVGGEIATAANGSEVVLASADGGVSRELNLVAGPVRVSKVAVGFVKGQIRVAFDAVMTVEPVQLALIGLGVAVTPRFEFTPLLQGAGVSMDKPPVRLTGVLERRSDDRYAEVINGLLTIETGFFALLAAGSYVRGHDGWTSMFLFGEIAGNPQVGLFGPPAFRVNAISLGFGINSTVRQPRIDEVSEFPLVQRLSGGTETTPEQVLERLAGSGGWITPRKGQYWGAGGLEFSSFRFLDAKVLLLVEGGQDWKVMLLGRAVVDLPRSKAAKKPIARVAVDLAIAYRADENLFSMDVVVAPGSYVLDPDAQLTGGLSLYIWGKDRTAVGGGRGFVFTLGGYHRKFKKPSYYPVVPRVGWVWQLGPIAIRGQVYAAVTDGAFMAGGALDARYDAHHGIRVEAWFSAWLDVLVQWKPFYFDLSMGMSIGVAATVKVWFIRVRVSLSVGVDLELWGPPIGGRAKVKVWFISFTIGIGASRDGPAAIGWDEFRVQLPSPLSITPLHGILADAAPAEIAVRNGNGEPTLVSSDGFTIATAAVIPATEITLNGKRFAGTGEATANIRPMDKQGVRSVHKVSVWLGDVTEPGTRSVFDPEDEENGWTVTVVEEDMPKSLWGDKLNEPTDVLDGDGLLTGSLAGLRFEVPPPTLGDTLGPVSSTAFIIEPQQPALLPPRGAAPEGPVPVADPRSIAAIIDPQSGIDSSAARAGRAAVYGALDALGFAPGADGPLTMFTDQAATYFTDAPLTAAAP